MKVKLYKMNDDLRDVSLHFLKGRIRENRRDQEDCVEKIVESSMVDVRLRSLLKSGDGRTLESEISLEILSNFTDQALERKFADKELGTLLVLPDLPQRNCSRTETMRFLYAAGRRRRLPRRLGGQLLPWGLAAGRLASSLLRPRH
ncbi:hypothetical protein IEQ34_003750 [Dendrobium chrysotoxum]|uniref:Uncharacterized protein n=1 Tax=Dendrobium chrysotoxum TaxID=161865 RepID=A0AAV7HCB3_DENCH|nr:hypothetical protein IEQ34_003750 [Dendrobium chrysotoxum]